MHSNQTLQIRAACCDDAPALSVLLAELGFPTPVEEVALRLEALLGAGEAVLVATRGQTPLGLITVHMTPAVAEFNRNNLPYP